MTRNIPAGADLGITTDIKCWTNLYLNELIGIHDDAAPYRQAALAGDCERCPALETCKLTEAERKALVAGDLDLEHLTDKES